MGAVLATACCVVLTPDASGFGRRGCAPPCRPYCYPVYPCPPMYLQPGSYCPPYVYVPAPDQNNQSQNNQSQNNQSQNNQNPPPTRRPGAASKVNVLLIADNTDPKLAHLIRISVPRIEAIFRAQVARDYLNFRAVVPPNADGFPSADHVLSEVKGLGDLTGQSVLCFYLGHGAVDKRPDDPDVPGLDKHYLDLYGSRLQSDPANPTRRPLMRKRLMEAMKETKAQLRVLITDSCAQPQPVIEINRDLPRGQTADVDDLDVLTAKKPTLEALLLGYTGEIDINAATPPKELAFYTPETKGGVFTYVFTDLAQRQEITTWRAAVDFLDRETRETFRSNLFEEALKGNISPKPYANKIKDQGGQQPFIVLSSDLREAGSTPEGGGESGAGAADGTADPVAGTDPPPAEPRTDRIWQLLRDTAGWLAVAGR